VDRRAKQIEQKLLTTLIRDPEKIFDVDGHWITAEDFQYTSSRCIYSAIVDLASGSGQIDKIVLESKISEMFRPYYKRKQEAIRRCIEKLFATDPVENLSVYAKIVVNSAVKRRAKRHLKSMSRAVDDIEDYQDLISHFETSVAKFSVEQLKTSEITKVGENFDKWIQERIDRCKKGKSLGISSGLDYYDEAIGGGFRRGTIDIIAARAKTGKSFLAFNIAWNVAKQNIPVLYLDTELDEDSQMDRLISIMSGVPIKYLETGKFLRNSKMKTRVKKARKAIRTLPLDYVEIKGWPIRKQISYIRSWFARIVGKGEDGLYKPALVILDYLKIMDLSDKGNNMAEWEALGHNMSSLHNLMGELQSPMFTMVQQNRIGIEEDHEGTISGSDRLSWFCDSLAIMARRRGEDIIADYENPERNEGEEPANLLLKVRLSRFGSGNEDGEYILLYSDIRNPRMPNNKKTGKIEESEKKKFRFRRRGVRRA